MPEVFVGVGSNIEPERHLGWALDQLRQHFGETRASDVYRSPAFGFDGPDFLNLVVAFESVLHVDQIEAVLSELENECGRDSGARSGSRTLDLDLLLFGCRIDAGRRLPRTDILIYPFVLTPLRDLAPGLVHPVTGVSIDAAWTSAELPPMEMTRLGRLLG